MRLIEAGQMEAIALGSAVYGTGGGGDPYIGKLLAQNAMRRHGAVQLIGLDELADDDLIVPVAMAGSPTVLLEKMAEVEPLIGALRALEARLGRKAKALLSIEVGGMNSTIPFCVASALGLPLVDGDTMGRAFPDIQMSLCTLVGIGATPLAMTDEHGNALLVEAIDNRHTERFVRSIIMDMGGSSYMALYAMTARQARSAIVAGTITLAERAGQTLFDARARHLDPVAELLRATGGYGLFRGKVLDVQRSVDGRHSKGVARLAGLDEDAGGEFELHFQNEFLLARRGDMALCSAPDLIVAADIESGEPVTAEQMRFGLRLAILGLPCVSAWRTPAALALVGPRCFGYELDYRPVEQAVMDSTPGPASVAGAA